MYLDPLLKSLVDAGGLAVAAAVAIGVIILIVRGDLVPGSVYRREAKRADTATAQAERQTEMVEHLTDRVETLGQLMADVLRPK